jgi:hypothetical protein
MEIKTLVLKVLTELNVVKGRVDLLQEEIRRSKVEVSDNTDSAVKAQHEVNISIQNPLKNSQVLSREMDVSAERRELKSNVGELNQFLKTDERQPVKEVILTDVNTLPAKITCLSDTNREQSLKEAMWSDVVAGKYKKLVHGRQEKTYSIPVIKIAMSYRVLVVSVRGRFVKQWEIKMWGNINQRRYHQKGGNTRF